MKETQFWITSLQNLALRAEAGRGSDLTIPLATTLAPPENNFGLANKAVAANPFPGGAVSLLWQLGRITDSPYSLEGSPS